MVLCGYREAKVNTLCEARRCSPPPRALPPAREDAGQSAHVGRILARPVHPVGRALHEAGTQLGDSPCARLKEQTMVFVKRTYTAWSRGLKPPYQRQKVAGAVVLAFATSGGPPTSGLCCVAVLKP